MFALFENNKKIGATFLSFNDCLENAIYMHTKCFDVFTYMAGRSMTCTLKKGYKIKEIPKP